MGSPPKPPFPPCIFIISLFWFKGKDSTIFSMGWASIACLGNWLCFMSHAYNEIRYQIDLCNGSSEYHEVDFSRYPFIRSINNKAHKRCICPPCYSPPTLFGSQMNFSRGFMTQAQPEHWKNTVCVQLQSNYKSICDQPSSSLYVYSHLLPPPLLSQQVFAQQQNHPPGPGNLHSPGVHEKTVSRGHPLSCCLHVRCRSEMKHGGPTDPDLLLG